MQICKISQELPVHDQASQPDLLSMLSTWILEQPGAMLDTLLHAWICESAYLHAGSNDGGHDEGTLRGNIILRQLERLLHNL